MGNGVTLKLSKAEEETFTAVKNKIAKATDYKSLLRSVYPGPPDPKNLAESLIKDSIDYSRIYAISKELSEKIKNQKKPVKEK